jgi:hypothetical protein
MILSAAIPRTFRSCQPPRPRHRLQSDGGRHVAQRKAEGEAVPLSDQQRERSKTPPMAKRSPLVVSAWGGLAVALVLFLRGDAMLFSIGAAVLSILLAVGEIVLRVYARRTSV